MDIASVIKKTFTALLVLLFLSGNASALSQSQLDIYNSGINYFDTTTQACTTLSSQTGTGPLYGPFFPDVSDPSVLAGKIQSYIQNTLPSSPLISYSTTFVQFGQQYNVSPALVVAMAQKETSLGTAGNGAPSGGYNITNLRPNGFARYNGYQQGIEESYKNLAGNLYLGSPSNFTSVSQIINRWAPPSDNNDTSGYIDFVNSAMHKMLDGLTETGAPSNSGVTDSSFTPGSASDSTCQASDSYQAGANGYNLSGANSMASFHQCDSPWGAKPYGSGGDICDTGCGITSLAMIIDTLKGLNKTPDVYAQQYGSYNQGGTVWGLWPKAAADYGLNEQELGANFNKAAAIIRQGGLVIIPVDSSGGGYFTQGGHLMVLRAVDEQGNFYLADPGTNDQGINSFSHATETTAYSASFLENHGFMGDLFGFTK